MKDEIKEILEGIKVVIKHDGTLEFNAKELKILLDYITNLQEELEGIKDNFKIQLEYDEELENKITNLQEELEEEKRIEQADFKIIQNLEEENEKLKVDKETIKRWYNLCKSRNEKAIEYIKQLEHSDWITFGRKILLEILGGDEEC